MPALSLFLGLTLGAGILTGEEEFRAGASWLVHLLSSVPPDTHIQASLQLDPAEERERPLFVHPELGRGACLSQPGGEAHQGMWSAHLPGPAQVRRLRAAGVFPGASGGEGNEDTWG